jgi:DNA polymerase-3 subunit beta
MKIVFEKSKLLDALSPAMGTVCTKNTIPSIEGVLIETMEGNTVRLSTFDMNKGMRVMLTAERVIEPGSYIIHANRLMQILRVLSEDTLTIAVSDDFTATVTSGLASFSLSALAGKDFPSMPELTGLRGFEVSSEILRDMITKTIHSVAEQDARAMLCGAYFRIMQNRMEVISCDSYTLSRCSVQCEIRDVGELSALDFSFLVPGHALNELVRVLNVAEAITTVKIARKHAIFCMGDIIFFTRMIDSEYIDYERIIPRDQNIFVEIDRARFLAALERANLIAEEKIVGSARSYVKLVLSDGKMSVTSTSVNGRVYDEIPIKHEGADLEIGFNCRYLINSVRASTGETLDLSFKTPTQSVTMVPHEKSEERDFFYMVLPVRMNG